jgi:hypothetical protein
MENRRDLEHKAGEERRRSPEPASCREMEGVSSLNSEIAGSAISNPNRGIDEADGRRR